jgi:hypothetical protein
VRLINDVQCDLSFCCPESVDFISLTIQRLAPKLLQVNIFLTIFKNKFMLVMCVNCLENLGVEGVEPLQYITLKVVHPKIFWLFISKRDSCKIVEINDRKFISCCAWQATSMSLFLDMYMALLLLSSSLLICIHSLCWALVTFSVADPR